MAQKTVYVSGLVNYARVLPDQLDKEYNQYQVDFFPDEQSWEILKETGVEFKIRENNTPKHEGDATGKFIKLRRHHSKLMGDEVTVFGPPKVVLNLHELDENNVSKTVAFDPKKRIGNGSEVTLRLTIYQGAKQKKPGCRLEGVRVDKFIEFVPTPNAERKPTPDFPF